MTPNRPYLIRALYQWLVDNDLTPHLLVDATAADVVVPQEYVKDGRIVLNVSPGAVRDLELGNDLIAFNARFGGVARDVTLPPRSVLGIYARENGRGMLFPEDEEPPEPPREGPGGGERPHLKVVK